MLSRTSCAGRMRTERRSASPISDFILVQLALLLFATDAPTAAADGSVLVVCFLFGGGFYLVARPHPLSSRDRRGLPRRLRHAAARQARGFSHRGTGDVSHLLPGPRQSGRGCACCSRATTPTASSCMVYPIQQALSSFGPTFSALVDQHRDLRAIVIARRDLLLASRRKARAWPEGRVDGSGEGHSRSMEVRWVLGASRLPASPTKARHPIFAAISAGLGTTPPRICCHAAIGA